MATSTSDEKRIPTQGYESASCGWCIWAEEHTSIARISEHMKKCMCHSIGESPHVYVRTLIGPAVGYEKQWKARYGNG